jgi:thioredoxin-dependent peroxiredoxin
MRSSLRLNPFTLAAVALTALVVMVGFFGPARAEEPLLAVGAAAPEVVGTDAKGTTFKLSAQVKAGKYAIVYFYPKDDTPGCTKEACAFRDAFDKFVAAGVTIFGVSRDPEPSHKAFMQKYTLPFPLVADPSGAVQRAYRVPSTIWGGSKRVTFLVGTDGRIARVYPDVDPGVHAKELLAAIASLGHRGVR